MKLSFNYHQLSLFPMQAQEIMKDYQPGLLSNGGKFVLLFNLLQEALAMEDKVLVFRYGILVSFMAKLSLWYQQGSLRSLLRTSFSLCVIKCKLCSYLLIMLLFRLL